MAGGKKKKKPVSNPARGFATTSIASKPRADIADSTTSVEPVTKEGSLTDINGGGPTPTGQNTSNTENIATTPKVTSPEDFEKQLEESELQVLVEKHAQKSKRDAGRQIARLQTDRRLLRGQADALNTRKWLPPELMEEILDIILVDSRSSSSGAAPETTTPLKALSEEDLTIKLWTLQQTLSGAGFARDKVNSVLAYILEISEKVVVGNKDSIWGLEEALDWLARECSRTELPDYESSQRKMLQSVKASTGW